MFKRSKPSPVHGGLAVFSPRSVAGALVKEKERPEQSPREAPTAEDRRPLNTTISVDLGTAFKGAVAVAEYLVRRQARKREAEKALESKTLELAAEYQGLVGVPDLLLRADCDRKQAEQCLTRLEAAQVCRFLCHYREEALYVFPGHLPRTWECAYCGGQSPVPLGIPSSRTCECANCGAIMSQKILC